MILCQRLLILLICTYKMFVCLSVCPSPGAQGPKTGPKAKKEGRRPLKKAEGPVWGSLAPTQTESMLAEGHHESSSCRFYNFLVI